MTPQKLTTQKRAWTEGPWEVGEVDDGLWVSPPNRGQNVICDIVGRTFGQVGDEDVANARLIAASPDLYEALVNTAQALAAIADGPGLIAQHLDALDMARTALKKANPEGQW